MDLVSVKVVGRAASGVTADALARLGRANGAGGEKATRSAYFGAALRVYETPVLPREALRGEPRRGPIIVEEYDATSVVPPDCTASVDGEGNLLIRLGEAS
jgi:N-methylhydantoinase A